jgi:UDP-N-acetylmuramoylalanine--D-glutamate ligase
MKLTQLSGRRTVVWGLGKEGRAAARAALKARASDVVAVVDDPPASAVLLAWAHAGLSGVPIFSGPAAQAARNTAEVVLLSPGISRYRPELIELEHRGVYVTNGTAMFLADHAASTIAVTGSKGKSTVTLLTAHLFNALGRDTVAAGNLGTPLLDLLGTRSLVVAEISSYQAALVTCGPQVTVLTSLFPDHLPWHGNVERYYADKFRLFASQRISQHGLVNGADPIIDSLLPNPALANVTAYAANDSEVRLDNGMLIYNGTPTFSLKDSRLPGIHNNINIAGAVAVLARAGINIQAETERLEAALASFSPLPHRLEIVNTVNGVTFVDDSLATTPQAAIAACKAFPSQPLTLLVGGLDRGVDYTPLITYLKERATRSAVALVAMGPAGRRIANSLDKLDVCICDDLPGAVHLAASLTSHGVVLFSPAAPSPAEYGSYEHRSHAFRISVEDFQRAL